MDVIERIDFLMKERKWSTYKLSQESGLSSSTIANIHRRNTVPSITTLEAICKAFNITLAQFFSEPETSSAHSDLENEFFSRWSVLSPSQKELMCMLIKEMK